MSNYTYRFLSSTLQPDCELIPSCIGKTKDEITDNYFDYQIINQSADSFDMEIRLENATLTCIFNNNICTDARLFRD